MLLSLRSLYEVTAVLVTAAGVSASPNIGTPSVKVTYAISGVAAAPAVGSTSEKVTVTFSGVAAAPAVGSITENARFTSAGVAASPAIGVGSFNSDFALSGVVASSTVGTAQLNVSFTLSGVSANAQIGDGTVQTPQPGQVIVNLTGVAADPQIGTGTVYIQSIVTYPRPISEGWPRQRPARSKPDKYVFIPPQPPPPIVVEAQGVKAFPNVRNARKIKVNADAPIQSPPLTIYSPEGTLDVSLTITGGYAMPSIGTGEVKRVIDLTEEEIITLMEAA